jgi:predicted RNase H-like HicB family nuclease/DNA-binding XRE family transcriptional regulator
MVYHFKIRQEGRGYWAECLELRGCSTQAESLDDLAAGAYEALNLYLEEPQDSSVSFALPQRLPQDTSILEVPVDPQIALSVLLRSFRASHNYTQKDVAEKLGMRNVYSYQRLERRCNPSLSTLQKLREVFPDLSIDCVLQDAPATAVNRSRVPSWVPPPASSSAERAPVL